MELNTPIYSSRQFSLHEGNKLVAEASDLSRGDFWARVYDDACDIGFRVRSAKTNRVITFTMVDQLTRNGEIEGWRFEPVDRSVNCQVYVYND